MKNRMQMEMMRRLADFLIVCLCIQAASAQKSLELAYDKLNSQLYRPRNSDVIYADSDHRLVLGCLLPSGTRREDEDTERRYLRWRKNGVDRSGGSVDVCSSPYFPSACSWEDYMFARGAQVLSVQLHETDNPSKGILGSGEYQCYHSRNGAGAASTRVWVAGSYLEILVNGNSSPNKTHRLPETGVKTKDSDDGGTYVLECAVGAGARNLAPNSNIEWFRDTKQIYASNKYSMDKSGSRLELRNANPRDEGVYMCQATVVVHNLQSPVRTLQYVILQGGNTSSGDKTSSIHWRLMLLLQVCIVGLIFKTFE